MNPSIKTLGLFTVKRAERDNCLPHLRSKVLSAKHNKTVHT